MGRAIADVKGREWEKRSRRYADSQLTVGEFCVWEGVSVAALYVWRKKLAGGKPRRRTTTSPDTAEVVAVGTALSGGPPHRSGRAELPHPALTSGVWHQSLKVDLVLFPCHAVDSRCCHTLERVKALSKCPGRGSLRRFSLSRSSFLSVGAQKPGPMITSKPDT